MTVIRECTNPACTFRYPDHDSVNEKAYCPKCGQVAVIKEIIPEENPLSHIHEGNPSFHLRVIVDNVRSIYNVGSIFRTSDGFGVEKLYLCGITPTPENPRFHKTSLGAEGHLPWTYHNNAVSLCKELKNKGYRLIALENSISSTNLYAISHEIIQHPLVLIVGNEVSGIDPQIQKMSDLITAIPMSGYKQSFNVATAYGIAVSYLYSLTIN